VKMNERVETLMNEISRDDVPSHDDMFDVPLPTSRARVSARSFLSPALSNGELCSLEDALKLAVTTHASDRIRRSTRAATIVVRAAINSLQAISEYETEDYMCDPSSLFAIATWALENSEAAFFNSNTSRIWQLHNDRIFTLLVRNIAQGNETTLLRTQAREIIKAGTDAVDDLLFIDAAIANSVLRTILISPLVKMVVNTGVLNGNTIL
jgi:hypothetical protein